MERETHQPDAEGGDSAGNSAWDSAWEFSVDLYGRPGAREACLDLQDRLGVDVVVLLALVHRASSGGGGVTPEQLSHALDQVDAWRRATVLPLRAIRRALKNWSFPDPGVTEIAGSARQSIAQAEAAAERAELIAFARELARHGHATIAPGDPAGRLGAAAAFLRIYWHVLGLEADEADRSCLAAVLSAAFPEVDPQQAQAIVGQVGFKA